MIGLQERYEQAWGPVVDSVSYARETEPVQEFRVLVFLPAGHRVGRVATHGLSSCVASDGLRSGVELLFAIDAQFVKAQWIRTANFVADVAVHLLKHAVRPSEGSVTPLTSLAPWPPDALIYDLPRGESEEFEHFEWDGEHCHLVWVIPAYKAEAELVRSEGMEAFDILIDQTDSSLADVMRPPLVS